MKIFISKILGKYLFDENYLNGKFFENSNIGWEWVWRSIFWQKILGVNRDVPYPVSHLIGISYYKTIEFDASSLNVFQGFGNYFCTQWNSKIIIGKDVWIGPNTGIISANHDFENPNLPGFGKTTRIDDNCWIGMNCMILPGVHIGKNTIVGAGSVVTKSFPEGDVIIAGNPAKIIRRK